MMFTDIIQSETYRRKDCAMSLKYGIALPQGALMDLVGIKDPVQAYETMTRVAQTVEDLGFDSIWLGDVFQAVFQPSQEMTFECWTSTAALARDTKRVRIGQAVTCNSYRNPALLAKMASTVDVLSHGRLTFGIGSGWHEGGWREQEYRAYGYVYSEAVVHLRQLREAVQVMLAMWTQEEAVFEGSYYQVRGAINQPKGVQQPHIPLLIAGEGEKGALKLVAQYGDACHIHGDPATVAHKFTVLKEHCETVGRDYESIRRTVATICSIADTDEQARANLPDFLQAWPIGFTLVGSLETIRKRIAAYEEAGVQELIIRFPDAVQLDSLRRFAQEFIV
jgi:F420-dependent oxidoreductase-like protein